MVRVVILCGGLGTRLWPLSRQHCPKQFVTLPGATYNLFEQTLIRSQQLHQQCHHLVIISNQSMKEQIIKALLNVSIKCPVTLMWEPSMRNTGPAIGSLVKLLQTTECDQESCLILPSDHILSVETFNQSLQLADQLINDHLLTFGICPTYAETGYGYIIEGIDHRIEKFIEKPPLEVAQQLITQNNVFWNSGMFYFNSSVIQKEFDLLCPDLLSQIDVSKQHIDEYQFLHVDLRYHECPNLPFDKMIMEKTQKGCVIPFRGLWSDIGSWEAICQLSNNYHTENCVTYDVTNCHVYNYQPQQLVTILGLDDLCVVNTPDALLIAKISETQKVKNMVQLLEKKYL